MQVHLSYGPHSVIVRLADDNRYIKLVGFGDNIRENSPVVLEVEKLLRNTK